jgi:hypothetical protein
LTVAAPGGFSSLTIGMRPLLFDHGSHLVVGVRTVPFVRRQKPGRPW